MSEKDLSNASVTILLEIDGMVHLVAMEHDKKDAVEALVKMASVTAYRTKKSQNDLRKFLGL